MSFRKLLPVILFLLFNRVGLSADGLYVVATTPWSGAFVRAAGVEEVDILAPSDLRNPSEYVLDSSDIQQVVKADLLVYAGYESMIPRLKAVLGKDADQLLQIRTAYSWPVVKSSVMKIAAAAGTTAQAETSLNALETQYDAWKIFLNGRGLLGMPVITHFSQRPLVEELGFTIVGIIGPGPPEPRQISELAKTGTTLIIDDRHNPAGAVLEDVIVGARRIEWINYPGSDGTLTLGDVLDYNRKKLEGIE